MLGIHDGDSSLFTPTDEELSVSCGCTAASPSPTTASPPAPSTEPACGEGDSFSVVSDSLPVAEGCYLDTGFVSYGIPVYFTTGTIDAEQQGYVHAVRSVEGDTTTVSANRRPSKVTHIQKRHNTPREVIMMKSRPQRCLSIEYENNNNICLDLHIHFN